MKLTIGSFLLVAVPFLASAQTLSAQGFIASFLVFSNKVLIPFLLGIAFLFFVFNVFRFFIVGGSSDDGREKAKDLALYSVLAFVIIVVFWGIVNLLSSSLGFNDGNTPTPDYLEKNGTTLKNNPPTPSSNTNRNAVPTNNSGPTNLLPPSMGGPAQNGSPVPSNPPAPSAIPPSGGGPAVEDTNCSNGFDSDGNVCGIY